MYTSHFCKIEQSPVKNGICQNWPLLDDKAKTKDNKGQNKQTAKLQISIYTCLIKTFLGTSKENENQPKKLGSE